MSAGVWWILLSAIQLGTMIPNASDDPFTVFSQAGDAEKFNPSRCHELHGLLDAFSKPSSQWRRHVQRGSHGSPEFEKQSHFEGFDPCGFYYMCSSKNSHLMT